MNTEAVEKAKNVLENVVKEFQGIKSQFKSEDEECKFSFYFTAAPPTSERPRPSEGPRGGGNSDCILASTI